MLKAWANDTEFQLSEGNPAIIELVSSATLSGHTETFTISDDGLSVNEIEIDE